MLVRQVQVLRQASHVAREVTRVAARIEGIRPVRPGVVGIVAGIAIIRILMRGLILRAVIARIAMVHRLGRLEISETSVAVVVTAPHRRPAFDAALEGINRLKKLVPVWKKEYFVDGEVWVEGEWDDAVIKAQP